MYFLLFAVLIFWQNIGKTHGSAVDFLNEATFTNSIGRSPHFVLFYAPWCGHCKSLLASWNELAEQSNENDGHGGNKVKIAKVNCMADVALCSEQNILAYPTIKLFNNGIIKRFDGRRSVSEFTIFIENTLNEMVEIEEHEGLVTLTTDNFYAHIKAGLHFVDFFAPWCVHCQRLAPTWKAIAKRYETNPDITICKVDCTVESVKCQELKITAFPMLKMFKDGEEVDNYNLARQMDTLVSYIDNQLVAYGSGGQPKTFTVVHNFDDDIIEQPNNNKDIPAPASLEKNDENVVDKAQQGFNPVLDLLDETFDAVIVEPTFIMFYAPWCQRCQLLKPIWETLAVIFQKEQGPIIARVDCSISANICKKYQISNYPTLVLFKDGKRYFYNEEETLESLHIFAKGNHDEL